MSWIGGIVILAALALVSGFAVLAAIASAIEVLPPRAASAGESGGGNRRRACTGSDGVAHVGSHIA